MAAAAAINTAANAAANASLQYLKMLDEKKRREVTRFVDAHRHDKNITEVKKLKWVAEAMELLAATKLSNDQKRQLVLGLYQDMAKDETNDYQEDFEAQEAIEFIWDVSKDRFGIVLNNKGCFKSCFPSCCTSISVMDDGGKVTVGIKTAEPKQADPPAPPTTPKC